MGQQLPSDLQQWLISGLVLDLYPVSLHCTDGSCSAVDPNFSVFRFSVYPNVNLSPGLGFYCWIVSCPLALNFGLSHLNSSLSSRSPVSPPIVMRKSGMIVSETAQGLIQIFPSAALELSELNILVPDVPYFSARWLRTTDIQMYHFCHGEIWRKSHNYYQPAT